MTPSSLHRVKIAQCSKTRCLVPPGSRMLKEKSLVRACTDSVPYGAFRCAAAIIAAASDAPCKLFCTAYELELSLPLRMGKTSFTIKSSPDSRSARSLKVSEKTVKDSSNSRPVSVSPPPSLDSRRPRQNVPAPTHPAANQRKFYLIELHPMTARGQDATCP
jgi:hypothetical protein